MSVATIAELMDQMGTTLETALSGSGWDIQVVPRMTFNPQPPCIDIYPADPFRGTETLGFGQTAGEFLFIVRMRASTVDNRAGQDLILRFLDDTDDVSIAVALEDDQTLNGLASSVDVGPPSGMVPYGDLVDGGVLLGFQHTVTIIRAET